MAHWLQSLTFNQTIALGIGILWALCFVVACLMTLNSTDDPNHD